MIVGLLWMLWLLWPTTVLAEDLCVLGQDSSTLQSVMQCRPRPSREVIERCLASGETPMACLQKAKMESPIVQRVCETMNTGKRYCIENGQVIEVSP